MKVISIECIGTIEKVYDLETTQGTFVGGGQEKGILLKNTDSCYVYFKDINIEDYKTEQEFMKVQFKMAQDCADYCTKQFKPPMSLTFEKFMYPFILFAKKQYAYLEWNEKEKPCKEPGFKGIQVVRRNYCNFVKTEMAEVIKIIMSARKIEDAREKSINYITNSVKKLLDNKVSIEDLVLTKQLKGEYIVRKNNVSTVCHWTDPRITQPHVRLAQKLRIKNPANHPKPPDRVPFVFIESKKEVLQCDKVELPSDAKNADGLYYFEHQLRTSIDTVFQFMMDKKGGTKSLYDSLVKKKINQLNKQFEISHFFK